MTIQSLNRWGAAAVIAASLLFAASAIAVILVPDGGLANPVAPTLYYAGLILAVPSYIALYAAQAATAGKLGFAGLAMSVIGSIMYSGPVFVLMAGTSGVATWHDVWGFAMRSVLPLGASIFLFGSTLFGVATTRAGVFPRQSGWLLAVGSFLWLIVFYTPVPFLLSIANLMAAGALAWMAFHLYPRTRTESMQARQAL
jgi:hypothetical protein